MGLRTRVLLSMCSSFRALISSRHFLDGSPSRNFTTLSLFSFCLVFVALPEMLGPYVGTKSSLLAVQHGRRSVFWDHIKDDDDEEEGRWKSGSRFINIRCLRFCWWFATMIFWHKDTTLCL
ncbi:hypothetical protein CY35_08G030400 [Sphagnum magellanicum]|nr:hypothetical protein CY35_08G030400 [Sphagnum magellanicum]